MSKAHAFARDEVFPSYFINALQELVSSGQLDFRLSKKDDTTIQVVPSSAFEIAGINIDGRYRWVVAAVERIHPGGARGTYTIWATATDDDIDDVPDPATDHTDRSFALAITDGRDPTADIFVEVGELDWSGAAITALRQSYTSTTGAMIEDGALSDGGDLTWTQEPGGGWVPNINARTISATEIADSLKPSAGAAAGTEALRALGRTASTAAAGDDARLSDTRVPTDGSVTLAKIAAAIIDAAAGTASLRTLGTGGQQATAGNDGRLSDQRVPTDRSVTGAKVADALKPSAGAAAGTEALRALGRTASTAAAGDDSRLSDQRVPTDASVTLAKMAADSVDASKILANAVGASEVGTLPGCRVYTNIDNNVPDEVDITLFFNSERWDSDAMHSTVTNSSRITCNTAGIYIVSLSISVSRGGLNPLDSMLQVTSGRTVTKIAGSETYATNTPGDATEITLTTFWRLAVGDYVEAIVRAHGYNATVLAGSATGAYAHDFGAQWVSD